MEGATAAEQMLRRRRRRRRICSMRTRNVSFLRGSNIMPCMHRERRTIFQLKRRLTCNLGFRRCVLRILHFVKKKVQSK
jgi:hypothetical protein